MHQTIENLLKITKVKSKFLELNKLNQLPKIIAVSKTFKIDHITPLINHGHVDFGKIKCKS